MTMNDERKEKAPPGVDIAILNDGRSLRDVTVYHVQDCRGRILIQSQDYTDVLTFLGSRMEH